MIPTPQNIIKNREREIIEMFDNFEIAIKEKLIQDVTESYYQLLKEIDRRGLARKNTLEYPRLNHFVKSLFFHLFEKLHRGDKNEANTLIAELKTQSSSIYYPIDTDNVSDSIRDDQSYAQAEFEAIQNKYGEILQFQLKELILCTYNNSLMEVNLKNLVQRTGYSPPSLESYIKLVFSFVFKKLHKGDKSKAYEILVEELALLGVKNDNYGNLAFS